MTLFRVAQIKKVLAIGTVNNRASVNERIMSLPVKIGDLG